jgi:carbonic anhydrase
MGSYKCANYIKNGAIIKIHKSVVTDFCQKEYLPEVDSSAFIHPVAAVIGHVFIGKRVMVAPFASVRGDEGC